MTEEEEANEIIRRLQKSKAERVKELKDMISILTVDSIVKELMGHQTNPKETLTDVAKKLLREMDNEDLQ